MEGIENIKVIVGFVLDGVADAQKAMADKEFNLKDSFLFVDNITQIGKNVQKIQSSAQFQMMGHRLNLFGFSL